MDKSTRNHIQRATQAARTLLEETFAAELEGTYDILLDGSISEQPGGHLSEPQKVTREKLVAAVAHKETSGLTPSEAAHGYLREAAFTTLNRFVALKMLEARHLVQECVSKGPDSSGLKEFTALAPGLVALEDKGYRLYIETIFDEVSQEVKVLFVRRDVASLLWPDRQTLLELLGILNAPELAGVWAEDETIGWVYQYFNGDEERAQMRAESQAPRNSRELAVRNQFFTPRYVVQFLTDNTLGRTWYEMMQGETKLAHLDYLVRRPSEVFLAESESAPESDTDDSELSQEELLQRTVHVPFRAKKDPRDLRILDPACGSGHFLLYTFDLLITIYEEAWADAGAADFAETGTQLRADHRTIEELRRAMPGLILRRNLHGVDIDPRAAQIAALALWMRAHRAYNQFEVDRAKRPPITKTNIVVAEPMPGDAELVEEFAAGLKPVVLGGLFKRMVEEMKLAGELGSLLKIEESIAKAVKEAEAAHQQEGFFAEGIENRDFWGTADEKIITALGSFAESAAGAGDVRRQLFAGDATQGVAFVEVMRGSFDAVLMNPPFGQPTAAASAAAHIPGLGRDIGAAFVARFAKRLVSGGSLGVLANRLLLHNVHLESWRELVFYGGMCSIRASADLGHGVLDAMVETNAAVLSNASASHAVFVDLLGVESKSRTLQSLVSHDESARQHLWLRDLRMLSRFPSKAVAYNVGDRWLQRLSRPEGELKRRAYTGLSTGDNFRYVRAHWEAPATRRWRWIAKGGEYSKYKSNTHLVADGHFFEFFSRLRNPRLFGRAGATYTYRTTSNLSCRVLNRDVVFSDGGPGILDDETPLHVALALYNSFAASYVVELLVGGGDYSSRGTAARNIQPTYLDYVPSPMVSGTDQTLVASMLIELIALLGAIDDDETEPEFPGLQLYQPMGFQEASTALVRSSFSMLANAYKLVAALEGQIEKSLRLSPEEVAETWSSTGWPWPQRNAVAPEVEGQLMDIAPQPRGSLQLNAEGPGRHRFQNKLSHYLHAEVEAQSHQMGIHPGGICTFLAGRAVPTPSFKTRIAFKFLQYFLGLSFGRWPARRSDGDDIFAPITRSNRDSDDPPTGTSAALLCDDPGHANDVVETIRRDAKGHGVSPEFLQGLEEVVSGKSAIRLWVRRNLFTDHLAAYSRSRRRAPIYWQLATPSASYSVWSYYHRLNRDTFFRVVNDYVAPKVDHEERKLNTLRREAGPDPSSKQRKEVDAQETFVAELRAFSTEVKRIAPLWNPNLDDGVIINFAPLWRLVPQHKAWQKECRKVWDKLVNGDYDWAHLAMHLWPERVVPKCQDDRSLAIAHGIGHEFWAEGDHGKWHKRQVSGDRITELVDDRSSTAVKAALQDLLDAPAPTGTARRKRNAKV